MPQLQNPGFPIIAVLMIFLVIFAGFIPAFYASNTGQDTKTRDFDTVGENIAITNSLYAEARNLTGPTSTLRVYDRDSDFSKSTQKLSPGESETLSLNGQEITIKHIDTEDSKALFTFTYPVNYAWSDIQITLVNSIGILFLLTFVFLIFLLVGGNQ